MHLHSCEFGKHLWSSLCIHSLHYRILSRTRQGRYRKHTLNNPAQLSVALADLVTLLDALALATARVLALESETLLVLALGEICRLVGAGDLVGL